MIEYLIAILCSSLRDDAASKDVIITSYAIISMSSQRPELGLIYTKSAPQPEDSRSVYLLDKLEKLILL